MSHQGGAGSASGAGPSGGVPGDVVVDPVNPERPVLSEPIRPGGVDETAELTRRLAATLMGSDATAIASINDRLRALVEEAEALTEPESERLISMWAEADLGRYDPIAGSENPFAVPLDVVGRDDGSVQAVASLGLVFQGPPGHVHGGVSALLLDHLLGMANHWGAGPSGMTGTLTLKFHAPTPLLTELTFTAKQAEYTDRKTRTVGTISIGDPEAGGTVCVSAEGIFVNKFVKRPGTDQPHGQPPAPAPA